MNNADQKTAQQIDGATEEPVAVSLQDMIEFTKKITQRESSPVIMNSELEDETGSNKEDCPCCCHPDGFEGSGKPSTGCHCITFSNDVLGSMATESTSAPLTQNAVSANPFDQTAVPTSVRQAPILAEVEPQTMTRRRMDPEAAVATNEAFLENQSQNDMTIYKRECQCYIRRMQQQEEIQKTQLEPIKEEIPRDLLNDEIDKGSAYSRKCLEQCPCSCHGHNAEAEAEENVPEPLPEPECSAGCAFHCPKNASRKSVKIWTPEEAAASPSGSKRNSLTKEDKTEAQEAKKQAKNVSKKEAKEAAQDTKKEAKKGTDEVPSLDETRSSGRDSLLKRMSNSIRRSK